jgi:hypothetical protein
VRELVEKLLRPYSMGHFSLREVSSPLNNKELVQEYQGVTSFL